VALLGVRDLIVVETADALLVCSRHEAEKIKQLVTKVPPELQ
jgi:mannose-1-phosphate guanylyltransferase